MLYGISKVLTECICPVQEEDDKHGLLEPTGGPPDQVELKELCSFGGPTCFESKKCEIEVSWNLGGGITACGGAVIFTVSQVAPVMVHVVTKSAVPGAIYIHVIGGLVGLGTFIAGGVMSCIVNHD